MVNFCAIVRKKTNPALVPLSFEISQNSNNHLEQFTQKSHLIPPLKSGEKSLIFVGVHSTAGHLIAVFWPDFR